MKRNFLTVLLISFVSVILISCNSKNGNTGNSSNLASRSGSAGLQSDSTALPVLRFETEIHDFGRIFSGELVTYSFKFKNEGKTILLISDVSTSCGCTVTAFPKQPIKPGEESTIDVRFDSTGKHGIQKKMITVFSNTKPPVTTLRIKVMVDEPEDV